MIGAKIGGTQLGQICAALLQNYFGFENTYFYFDERPSTHELCLFISENRESLDKCTMIFTDSQRRLSVQEIREGYLMPALQKFVFARWGEFK